MSAGRPALRRKRGEREGGEEKERKGRGKRGGKEYTGARQWHIRP